MLEFVKFASSTANPSLFLTEHIWPSWRVLKHTGSRTLRRCKKSINTCAINYLLSHTTSQATQFPVKSSWASCEYAYCVLLWISLRHTPSFSTGPYFVAERGKAEAMWGLQIEKITDHLLIWRIATTTRDFLCIGMPILCWGHLAVVKKQSWLVTTYYNCWAV